MNPTKTLLINNIALAYKNENPPVLGREEIETYIQSAAFFEDVLKFDRTCIFVIEYGTWSYLYCSSNLRDITGYGAEEALKYGPEFTLSHIHTDDLLIQEKAHHLSVELFTKLPAAEKNSYKFAFTFRHQNPDGKEIRILQNSIFLKWDKEGRPLVKLILATDISAYKQHNEIVFFVSRLNAYGKNELVFQKNLTSGQDRILSPREIEIVSLIAADQSAEEIGASLGISVNTVKNHKKGIMKKLGCKNRSQVIGLARLYGLLPCTPASVNDHKNGGAMKQRHKLITS